MTDLGASAKRKMLFVGGIDSSINEENLYSAFIPFGMIKEISIPKDYKNSNYPM